MHILVFKMHWQFYDGIQNMNYFWLGVQLPLKLIPTCRIHTDETYMTRFLPISLSNSDHCKHLLPLIWPTCMPEYWNGRWSRSASKIFIIKKFAFHILKLYMHILKKCYQGYSQRGFGWRLSLLVNSSTLFSSRTPRADMISPSWKCCASCWPSIAEVRL